MKPEQKDDRSQIQKDTLSNSWRKVTSPSLRLQSFSSLGTTLLAPSNITTCLTIFERIAGVMIEAVILF